MSDVVDGGWLIAGLKSKQIIGGVLEVWSRLPEDEKKMVRIMLPLVYEADLTGRGLLGLHQHYTAGSGKVHRLIYLERTLGYSEAARIFAHELAHVVLRHGELSVGTLKKAELLREYVEDQAERLVRRWGFG